MFCNTHFSCTPLMHLLTDWIFWLLNLVLNFTSYFYPHYTLDLSNMWKHFFWLILLSYVTFWKLISVEELHASVQVIQEVHNWVCYLYNWHGRQHMKPSSIMPAVHSSVLGQPMSLIGRIIWQDDMMQWCDRMIWCML